MINNNNETLMWTNGRLWVNTDTYEIQNVRWVLWCTHGGSIGYLDWRTPDWCPVIAAGAKEEKP